MQQPILVEIIAFAPTAFYHCTHCEVAFREMGKSDRVQMEQWSNSLPADLMEEYLALSDWVRSMFQLHCDRIAIKMVDAASIEGVFMSLRYRTRRFPAVIVDQRGRFAGRDALTRAADEIGRRLNAPAFAASPA
ncbi:MAG: hypothetical protein V1755_15420 [Chloroflexota bacterium]